MKLLIVFLSLTFFATTCAAQDQWDNYQRRTLRQVIELNKEHLADNEAKVQYLFGNGFPSRVKVVYTGKVRALSKVKVEVIDAWAKSRAVSKDIVDLFEQEMLFLEGSEEHWLPVQKQVLPFFDKELKPSETVELFVVWIGTRKEKEKVDWVFLVNEFKADAPERP